MKQAKQTKKTEQNKAIEVLTQKLIELGGTVFARYYMHNSQDDKSKKTIESAEFLADLFAGKVSKKDQHFLEPYLKPMYEVNNAIKTLQKEQE